MSVSGVKRDVRPGTAGEICQLCMVCQGANKSVIERRAKGVTKVVTGWQAGGEAENHRGSEKKSQGGG